MKLLLLLLPLLAGATDKPEYAVARIPEAMKANAYSVVRRHETVFTVKNPGEATERVRFVVTVLDPKGEDEAKAEVAYDKLRRVNELDGTLYDAVGKEIRKLRKSDVEDRSAVSAGSLMEDTRYRVADFHHTDFPYTVEFTYQLTTRNLMFYPRWLPHVTDRQSVENASLTVVMPPDLPLHYHELNGLAPVKTGADATGISYAWSVSGLPAHQGEPLAPAWLNVGPGVLTAPGRVEVEGYAGSISSWQDLSRFMYALNVGRDALPNAVVDRVKALTAPLPDPAAKVRAVYGFLQQTTRYVSIQLGLGGWQTFPARTVAETGYGDCKALTNYTMALLKSIGIPSHAALVRAGAGAPDVLPEFPSLQFNHVVLCVPLAKDTLWLECTDQHGKAGYAGKFTGNRHALLVTPEGGRLVATPRYAAADNGQFRRVEVTLKPAGDASAMVTTRYTGLQHDDRDQLRTQLSPDEQRRKLYEAIGLPSFDLTRFAFTPDPAGKPALTETLALEVRKWAAQSGNRLFLNPNLLTAWKYAPPPAPRTLPFVTMESFLDTDTVTVRLPEGFAPEFKPDPVRIQSKFGQYESRVEVADGTLTYLRRMEMHRATHPPADYPAYTEWCRNIAKADRGQVVLVRKE